MNPMTSLRIHKGDVFGAESAPPKLMKLSDFVDKINLSYSLSPMMFGYFHEFEGEDKSMGIRFGVQDFHLETEVVQQKSEVELVSSPEGKRTGCLRSKWLLDSARLEINNIEARTIHFGSDATEDNFKDPNFDPSNSSFDEDTINWLLREERLQNPSSVRTEAFMWGTIVFKILVSTLLILRVQLPRLYTTEGTFRRQKESSRRMRQVRLFSASSS